MSALRIVRRAKPDEIQKQAVDPLDRIERSVRAAIAQGDKRLAGIDRQRIKPEVVKRDEAEIRRSVAQATAEDLRRAGEIGELLESQRQFYGRPAVEARAKFDPDPTKDAQIGAYQLQRLAMLSPAELLMAAQEALDSDSLALAVAVRREAQRRPDFPSDLRGEVAEKVAAIRLPAVDAAALATIGAAMERLQFLAVAADEATTGKSRPVDRVAAAYGDTTVAGDAFARAQAVAGSAPVDATSRAAGG